MQGCVAEVAAIIIQMLPTSDTSRPIPAKFHSDIPNIQPIDLTLQLRVCYGGFPKLTAGEAQWSKIGYEPDEQNPLYVVQAQPHWPKMYFTIVNNSVVRVPRRK